MAIPPSSRPKRPPEHLIRRFHVGQIRPTDTIGTYLSHGWSLWICCRDCSDMIEWTPPELAKRFDTWPELRIVDLYPRLGCKGGDGCGGKDVAVFNSPYQGSWSWPTDGQ